MGTNYYGVVAVHTLMTCFIPYYLLPGALLMVYRVYVQDNCSGYEGQLAYSQFCNETQMKAENRSTPNEYWSLRNLVILSLYGAVFQVFFWGYLVLRKENKSYDRVMHHHLN